jgi:ferritin-like protein
MSSESLHEDPEKIGPEAVDLHRAIVSLMEEFEAVDWYNQRAKATSDPELRAILEHNRDEEKEHAAMALEWMRRRDPMLDEHLRTYLFKDVPVTEIEEKATGKSGGDGNESSSSDGSLGIGSLRPETAKNGGAKS